MLSKAFIILALTVAANAAAFNTAPIKLPLARRFNLTGAANILEHDQARARQMKLRGSSGSTLEGRASVINTVATNQAVIYTSVIQIGGSSYNVIIDTGSSNTWVGAVSACPTGCQSTRDTVSVQYGSGSFSGKSTCNEIICNINVGPGLAVSSQSMGCATSSTGFAPWDGILGIGPDDLTQGTLSPDTSSIIPTVTDNAFSQGIIPAVKIGVSFEPTTTTSVTNGELSWGGTDSTKFTGALGCVGVTATSPATFYWGINESITYGTTTILSTTAGIVDTGTTLILIASDAFARYKSATGAVSDGATGLLRITSTQFANLKNLDFHIGGVTYSLTPNGQIWPRSLNTLIGGTTGRIYLIVASIGTPSGQGLDFIDGYTFLERFYSVYDTTNHQVCFATTPFTTATTN